MLGRLVDRGEGSVSYLVVLALIGAVAAAVTVVAVPDSVATKIKAGVCEVASDDCDPGDGEAADGDDRPSQPRTSPTPGASPVGGLTPEEQELQAARDALSRSEGDLAGLEKEWSNFDLLKEIAKLGLDFIAGDIIACVKKPNLMDCLWAIVGLVPWGKIGKVLKSIPKIAKLIDRFMDLKRRLDKARKARKDARGRLDAAEEACERLRRDGGGNSFPPGTPVLMADGTRRPIERVRVGERVWATDPAMGRSGPRLVTARIVGSGIKELVDVVVDRDGVPGGATTRITATANHRFWVAGDGDWIDAEELTFGDFLVGPDGSRTLVVGSERHRRVLRVHNLTVDGVHSYYIAAAGTELLVHNCKDLDMHEEPPRGTPRGPHQLGHTIQDHVNVSDNDLIAHARDPRNRSGVAGRWTDKDTAQRAVDDVLGNPSPALQNQIQRWLREGRNGQQTLELPVQTHGTASLGDIASRNGSIAAAGNKFKIILHRAQDPKHKPGWYVYTTYPVP